MFTLFSTYVMKITVTTNRTFPPNFNEDVVKITVDQTMEILSFISLLNKVF